MGPDMAGSEHHDDVGMKLTKPATIAATMMGAGPIGATLKRRRMFVSRS